MESNNKLTDLVEQAVSSIKTLKPTDISQVESLQIIINQINECTAQISDAPAELLEQAQGRGIEYRLRYAQRSYRKRSCGKSGFLL